MPEKFRDDVDEFRHGFVSIYNEHPRRRSEEREKIGEGESSSPANTPDISDIMMSSGSVLPGSVLSIKNLENYIGRNTFSTATAHVEFIERARREQREKQQHLPRSFYGSFTVYLQFIAFSLLMGILCCYIPIKLFMVTSELIRSIGLFPITIFIIVLPRLLPLLIKRKYKLLKLNLKLVWKYYFWLLVGTILKSNKIMTLKFADFVRRMIPNLAPCNALHDDVTCTTLSSTFIAKTHEDVQSIMATMYSGVSNLENLVPQQNPSLLSGPLVKLDSLKLDKVCRLRMASFSNQVLKIGEGYVIVMRLSGVQYRFTCVVRGEFLEDFTAITDWRSLAIILHILEFWQASPKVGVIENLTLTPWGDGIYCHALNLKKIVEGAHISDDYFSIFHIPEERRFYIGCGTGGMSENQPNIFKWPLGVVVAVIAAVLNYFQLKDDYLSIAITGLVILIVAPAIIGFIDLSGPLLMQSCFYFLSTLLCCLNAKWRLGVYLWLRKRGSVLAFCDEFNPDELRIIDNNTEVIYLHKSSYKCRKSVAVKEFPQWTSKINVHKIGTSDDWLDSWTSGNKEIKVKLFTDSNNFHAVTFEMECTCSNWFTKSRRVVLARSGKGPVKGEISTEVSLDGEATTYNWSKESFHLFLHLVLEWGRMNYGVVQNWENFMFRSYNHVYSIHGLAAHIETHKLTSYYLLLPDPQITQP